MYERVETRKKTGDIITPVFLLSPPDFLIYEFNYKYYG